MLSRILFLLAFFPIQAFSSPGSAKSNLKLRSQASSESESIGSISKGSKLEVLGNDTGGFYRVNLNGQVGYAASKFIGIEKPKIPPTFLEEVEGVLAIIYFTFSFVVGQMMVRPYLMKFFNSLTFFSRGAGPIMMFFEILEKRVFWEAFVAIIAMGVGFTFGWVYILVKVIKSKNSREPALESA